MIEVIVSRGLVLLLVATIAFAVTKSVLRKRKRDKVERDLCREYHDNVYRQ